MSRECIPGETVPLEVFSEEIKRRAALIGQRAMSFGLVAPKAVETVLEADPDDLRVAQLRNALTYSELDGWVADQTSLFQAASNWFENLDS